jgi:osmoprotectant transport system substrate-binding protein
MGILKSADPGEKDPVWTAVFAGFFILLSLLSIGCDGSKKQEEKKVTVGSKGFAENQIVSKLLQLALEDNGFKVDFIDNLDGEVLQGAIETGKIDLYPEYTNTGIVSILKMDPIFNTDEAYRTVKEKYKEKYNIIWLEPSSINNTYCLVLARETADRLGIRNISQLQAHAGEIRVAGAGWEERPDHLPAMRAAYGEFNFKSMTLYSGILKYQVLAGGQEDLTLGYTTDPQLESEKLLVLEDDKVIWPPYNLTPIVRQETLDKYPEIAEILNKVTRSLDTNTMVRLSAAVSIQHEEFEDVAKEFYQTVIR